MARLRRRASIIFLNEMSLLWRCNSRFANVMYDGKSLGDNRESWGIEALYRQVNQYNTRSFQAGRARDRRLYSKVSRSPHSKMQGLILFRFLSILLRGMDKCMGLVWRWSCRRSMTITRWKWWIDCRGWITFLDLKFFFAIGSKVIRRII